MKDIYRWNSDPKNQKMRLNGYCSEIGNLLLKPCPTESKLPPRPRNRLIPQYSDCNESKCEREYGICKTKFQPELFSCTTRCQQSGERKELNTSAKSKYKKRCCCSRRESSSSKCQNIIALSDSKQNFDLIETPGLTCYSDEAEKQRNEINPSVILLSVPQISRCRTMEILAKARKDSISSESSYQPEPLKSGILSVCKELDFDANLDTIEILSPNKVAPGTKFIGKKEQTLTRISIEPLSVVPAIQVKSEEIPAFNQSRKKTFDYSTPAAESFIGELSIEPEEKTLSLFLLNKTPSVIPQAFHSYRSSFHCKEKKSHSSKEFSLVQKSEKDISIYPQHDKSDYKTRLYEERESLQNSMAALKTENEYLRLKCSNSLFGEAPETKESNRKQFNLAIILLLFFVCILLLLKN